MKDPSDSIFTAIYGLLNSITYLGESIPCYNVVPQSAGSSYIWITGYDLSESSTNDRFMYEGYIVIQIVTGFDHPTYSEKKLDTIAGSVKNALKPTIGSLLDLSPDFNNTFFYLENDQHDNDLEAVENMSRRIQRWRIGVEELI